jgi:rhamnosyltransferase
MVKHADLLICDSREIEKYIKNEYGKYNLSTIFIAYGADIGASTLTDDDEKYLHWLEKYHIKPNNYYLVVGRFVPENNYETIIREFMSTDIPKDLVIITNMEENKFYNKLKLKNQFTKDDRIKFVGTVYDQELLKKIREKAYAYIHGHEVGGTNPSLLEALASTKINILFDISFNREVGGDSALYFSKNIGNLSEVINKVERLNNHDADNLSQKAKKIITNKYSWDKIINDYENLLISDFSSFNFNDIIDAKN